MFFKGLIVAIDGPSGSGKSTVSKKLAEELKGYLLDTGAMYRSIAYFVSLQNSQSEQDISKLAETIEFEVDLEKKVLLVNGSDLGDKLRTEKVSQSASSLSRYPSVRKVLTERQREIGREISQKSAVVVEGRDIGTVVFPDAPFKFFLTGTPEVRAKRRWLQLQAQGEKQTSLEEILRQINLRDKQDSGRKVAPLKRAKGAIAIDTSLLGIKEVVDEMLKYVRGNREK